MDMWWHKKPHNNNTVEYDKEQLINIGTKIKYAALLLFYCLIMMKSIKGTEQTPRLSE